MQFWSRELMGWMLLIFGIGVFLFAGHLLTMGGADPPNHYEIEVACVTIIGIVVFRGGLHLLKIATAAQLSQMPVPPTEKLTEPQIVSRRLGSGGLTR